MAFSLVPVVGKDFVDREELLEEMKNTFSTSNMGFALYGRRRVGKSSVFRELCMELSKSKNIVPVYLNIWKLVEESLEEFAKALSSAVLDAYRDKIGLDYRAKELLKSSYEVSTNLIRNLKIGIRTKDEMEYFFSMGRHEKKDIPEMVRRAFDLSEKMAEETGTKCILFIDEFPSIMNLKKDGSRSGEQIIRMIRTLSEEQKRTVLCICGSIKSTMDAVAISSTSAFYKQLIVKEIKPFEDKYTKVIIRKNLGKEITADGLKEVCRITRGVPFYINLLGKKLQLCKGAIDAREVQNSFEQLLEDEGTVIFKADLDKLSSKQRLVVIRMALNELTSLTQVAQHAGISHGTAATLIRQLEEKGVVLKTEFGKYELEDHFFKFWIKKRYVDQA